MKYTIEIFLDDDGTIDELPEIMARFGNIFSLTGDWIPRESRVKNNNGNTVAYGTLSMEADDDD